MAKSIPQIVSTIKRGQGSGNVFTAKQVKPYLDSQLKQAADAFKEFVISLIEVGGKHSIRRDGDGLWKNLSSTFTTDGAKLQVTDYAQGIDTGRKPRAKKVPLADLVKWIKRYRILGRQKKSGKYQKVAATSVNAAAYAIQTAIYKFGIKARPWIEQALDFQQKLVESLIDEILFPEIINVLELTFKDK
jgi:hypothetical protein